MVKFDIVKYQNDPKKYYHNAFILADRRTVHMYEVLEVIKAFYSVTWLSMIDLDIVR